MAIAISFFCCLVFFALSIVLLIVLLKKKGKEVEVIDGDALEMVEEEYQEAFLGEDYSQQG